ncbi:MAG: DUF2029 domain-containing protein [Candidatus Omnitrophica bacterium]|nr:DUF2029 domain-containing protein [Candidatus Omnitrophota bacterium]
MWNLLAQRPRILERACLTLLGAVFLIRFPIHFALTQPYLMTFEVYRAVAERVLDGGGAALYDPTLSATALFKYAPLWALAWAPLGWLTPRAGAILWTAVGVALLLATLALSARLCRRHGIRVHPLAAAAAVLLLVRPLTAELLNGQVNILWGLLVLAFLLGETSGRPWPAALSLALAVSLKLPALIVFAYLLVRRRFASAGRAALLFLVLNLAAAWALAPAGPLTLLGSWWQTLAASGPDRAFEIGSQSLLALMGRLLRADGYGFNVLALSDGAVAAVTAVLAAALFAAVCLPRARPTPGPARAVFDGALLAVLMVLSSPTCWVATYSALLWPAFVALALLAATPRATLRRPSLLFGAAALAIFSTLTHAKVWRFFGVLAIKGETYVFEVLMILPLLGLSLAWCLLSQRRLLTGAAAATRQAEPPVSGRSR